jgi:acyl-CoA synthetase (AMP-forming)/AMP-acid ligase II
MKPFLVQHLLESTCHKDPVKVAVKHGQETITFEQLNTRSGALAYGLQKMGIGRGERAGILLDNSIAQIISLLGALRAEYFVVLLNSNLREGQIQHILNDCGIKLLIASEKYSPRFQNIIKKTDVEGVHWDSELDEIAAVYAGKNVQYSNTGDDIASILYTSGSTGLPKGIVISHRNLIDGAQIVSHYLGITAAERILGLLPFNFDYGLNQLISTLYKGCTLVLFKFFMPSAMLNILADEKNRGLPAIPTVWSAVFNPQPVCQSSGGPI